MRARVRPTDTQHPVRDGVEELLSTARLLADRTPRRFTRRDERLGRLPSTASTRARPTARSSSSSPARQISCRLGRKSPCHLASAAHRGGRSPPQPTLSARACRHPASSFRSNFQSLGAVRQLSALPQPSASPPDCPAARFGANIDGGAKVLARTVIIATGAQYRKPALVKLSNVRRRRCSPAPRPWKRSSVVATRSSSSAAVIRAGQAAVFLGQTRRRVHVLVRKDGLADTMSRHLIRRIEETPSIVLRTRTEIVGLEGDGHLERIRWRDDHTGVAEARAVIRAGAVKRLQALARPNHNYEQAANRSPG